ncbi:PLP-dependent aminotransferase family protein [Sporolactobacillus vineae]|uniref:aminotransferase-like domain-containing protein n=1 Tax=Sporolactobacillus vineae TaxID=444463 RepID=UPI0002885BB8|nr:PLP-dependent aminotransferase family protein [Sporolactobacillus vineae]
MDQGIVYVTPSHQFPLGMILPVSKRMKLIQWADTNANRYIIEDDYDGEFRYIGKPIPSLQGLDQGKKVIYLGTFSKLFIPSLRISYMVLPPSLVAPYQQKFRLIKQTASTLNQQLIFRFMENGDWQHHLNRMRTLYKQKHQILVQELSRHFKGQGKIIGEKSGLHLIIEMNNGMSEQELIESARANGIKVYPTSIYYAANRTPEHPQILLGYGGLTENEIREGIKQLAHAWR